MLPMPTSPLLHVTIAGERVVLLAGRAAFHERTSTLLVADAHFGKAAVLRAHGVPLAELTIAEELARLDQLVAATGARRVVFLGDLLHGRASHAAEVLEPLGAWRASRAGLDMVLVRGNHDLTAGDPPASMCIACVPEPFPEPPFLYCHHPDERPGGHVIAGHVHPSFRLGRGAGESLRAPCFVLGTRRTILPAFGGLTGSADVELADGDRVCLAGETSVIEVPVRNSRRGGRAPRARN